MSQGPPVERLIDPAEKHLATVYATALLGAVEKSGNAEAVLAELDSLIRDVLDKLPQLEKPLVSPRLAHAEKVELIDRAFGDRMSRELVNFLKVLSRHGRLQSLRAIHHLARQLYNERRGRVQVQLRTATPVNGQLQGIIHQRLTAALGREVDVQSSVDPSLLGGIQIRIGDTVYDASVAHQLTRWRNTAIENMTDRLRGSLDNFLQE